MRSLSRIVAAAGLALAGGCGDKKSSTWKYPPPVFDTQRSARQAPQRPSPQPQRAPSGIAGEPAWTPPGGVKQRWTDIVIHHSASRSGGAVSFDRYHRTVQKWDELGYHFVIGNGTDTRDGLIEVGGRWRKQKHGAHCKTSDNYYNDHGIGICLVGDFSRTPPTRGQLASLERLLLFLSDRCDIASNRIRTHGGITHKTQCPGKHFSLAQVQRNLQLSQQRLAAAPVTALQAAGYRTSLVRPRFFSPKGGLDLAAAISEVLNRSPARSDVYNDGRVRPWRRRQQGRPRPLRAVAGLTASI